MRPPSSLVGQHARMPLLIFSMGITEPLLARRAAHGRRVGARRNAEQDALTRPLQVGGRGFLVCHGNTSCRNSTRVGQLTAAQPGLLPTKHFRRKRGAKEKNYCQCHYVADRSE